MIQHLLFDLDDTLWHFKKNSKLILKTLFIEQEVEKKFRLKFDVWHEKYYEFNGQLWADLRDQKIKKAKLRELRFKQSFEYFNVFDSRLNETFEQQYIDRLTDNNHLIPHVEEVLKKLSKDYKIHVVTNGFQDVSERKIANSSLVNWVETLTSADSAGVRKPDEKIFRHALNKIDTTVENALFIGDDWIADMQGACAIGIQAIFINTHQIEVDNTLGVPVINDFRELPNLIKELCNKVAPES